jgi:hypothetical protein
MELVAVAAVQVVLDQTPLLVALPVMVVLEPHQASAVHRLPTQVAAVAVEIVAHLLVALVEQHQQVAAVLEAAQVRLLAQMALMAQPILAAAVAVQVMLRPLLQADRLAQAAPVS